MGQILRRRQKLPPRIGNDGAGSTVPAQHRMMLRRPPQGVHRPEFGILDARVFAAVVSGAATSVRNVCTAQRLQLGLAARSIAGPRPDIPLTDIAPIRLPKPPGTFLTNMAVTALIVTGLYFGREILVPVALAVLFSFVLAPFVIRLQSWRVPRTVSVLVAVEVVVMFRLGRPDGGG
eukprot:gene40809-55161_t